MKTKLKALSIALTLIIIIPVLYACGEETVPNGRYEPEADMQMAIIIDGNNLTVTSPNVMTTTVKYTYNATSGAITITDGTVGLTGFEYQDGSIWAVLGIGEIEFKKQ
jgi:hypothetical protein